ncbi:hypothetical protein FACS1894167_12280 [Synergistales bacterium]|nr:hypothetical protein FACS1894167_12280 [Synergistales bacterium]
MSDKKEDIPPRISFTLRLSPEEAKAFRFKLLEKDLKAQDVLKKAVEDFLKQDAK